MKVDCLRILTAMVDLHISGEEEQDDNVQGKRKVHPYPFLSVLYDLMIHLFTPIVIIIIIIIILQILALLCWIESPRSELKGRPFKTIWMSCKCWKRL